MFDHPLRALLLGVLYSFSAYFLIFAANAQSAQLVPVTSVGDWSLYCAKSADKPKMSDCAVAGGTVSEQDPKLWVRLGLAFDPEGSNAKMTIRIPLTDYTNLKKGIFLSTDAEKIGRIFIDDCDKVEAVCRATVGMIARDFSAIFSAKTLNVQFQSERDKGVSLTVAMSGFLRVFDELQKTIGMKKKTAEGTTIAGIFGPNASTYSLILTSGVMAEKPADFTDASSRFLRSSKNCPAAQYVVKADRVQQSNELAKWIAATEKCTDGRVVLIKADFDQPDDVNRDQDTTHRTAKNEANVYDIANMAKLARIVYANVPNQRLDSVYQASDGTPIQIGVSR